MLLENIGLAVFITVVVVDVIVLLFDAYLKFVIKVPTISRRVWTHPIWGIPLVLWQLLGACGLAVHLFK